LFELVCLAQELERSTQPVTPFSFLMQLRERYPQFAQQSNTGAYMQQDAEECWTQLLYTLRERLKAGPPAHLHTHDLGMNLTAGQTRRMTPQLIYTLRRMPQAGHNPLHTGVLGILSLIAKYVSLLTPICLSRGVSADPKVQYPHIDTFGLLHSCSGLPYTCKAAAALLQADTFHMPVQGLKMPDPLKLFRGSGLHMCLLCHKQMT
jgi:hypothetical protein